MALLLLHPAQGPRPRPCPLLPAAADLGKVARATAGFTGAELMNLTNQAGGWWWWWALERGWGACASMGPGAGMKVPEGLLVVGWGTQWVDWLL